MPAVTWVSPVELIEYEIRQSLDEGRPVQGIAERWHAAVAAGEAATDLAGFAGWLLAQLDDLPRPAAGGEPDDLESIRSLCPDWPSPVPAAGLADRVLGGWQGRAAGCLLGKPVEGIPRRGIRELAEATGNWPVRTWFTAAGLPDDLAGRWPWHRSAEASLAESIDGMPEDDDLNYTMLGLDLLERHGDGFSTLDVAQAWLRKLPAGQVFTAERIAYRNLLLGLDPPATATWRNPFREWVGARIRGDVFGWACPGDPGRAAALAYRDAVLSHTRNGVYGEMFVAAASAAALVSTSIDEVIATGLSVVPPESRLAGAVRFAAELAGRERDFEAVVDELERRYGDQHWVHTINNTALSVAALVHGDGDFGRSISAVVSGGWDTDSNGALVGALVGALAGVDEQWVRPLRDRVRTSLVGFDRARLSDLAARTVAVAKSLGSA
jgi:ADP-ribosylglycohydrolase